MLIILARNIARNRRRRHDYARPHIVDDSIMEGLVSDTASADQIIAIAEQRAMTMGCMVTSNEVQRAIVQLRVIDDVPGENIARQLVHLAGIGDSVRVGEPSRICHSPTGF